MVPSLEASPVGARLAGVRASTDEEITARREDFTRRDVLKQICVIGAAAIGSRIVSPDRALGVPVSYGKTIYVPTPRAPGPDARFDILGDGADALAHRTLAELYGWLDWLDRFNVAGYVGEFGVPGIGATTTQWNGLLDLFYRALDDASVWSTQWAAGRGWGTTFPLGTYVNGTANGDIDTSQASAPVIEAHLESDRRGKRGVALAGWEFSVSGDGGPGARIGYQFVHSQADFSYLASRGVKTVRLGMAWERLQPTLSGALDASQLTTLGLMLTRARNAEIQVILDLHNYGRYTRAGTSAPLVLGITGSLTHVQLADFWNRLSKWVRADPKRSSTVLAYGLMNEPHDMPAFPGKTPAQAWEAIAQWVLKSIRNNGEVRTLLVAGYSWSQTHSWVDTHPQAWIVDPVDNFRYESHHYWDTTSQAGSRSGSYVRAGGGPLSYSTELAAAVAAGF